MTKEEKVEIKKLIISDIEKYSGRLFELKDSIAPISPDNAIGRISRMDAINNKSVSEAAARNIELRLNQLKHVFDIVDTDKYGFCTKCGQAIPIERLRIRPEIPFCAGCLKTGR